MTGWNDAADSNAGHLAGGHRRRSRRARDAVDESLRSDAPHPGSPHLCGAGLARGAWAAAIRTGSQLPADRVLRLDRGLSRHRRRLLPPHRATPRREDRNRALRHLGRGSRRGALGRDRRRHSRPDHTQPRALSRLHRSYPRHSECHHHEDREPQGALSRRPRRETGRGDPGQRSRRAHRPHLPGHPAANRTRRPGLPARSLVRSRRCDSGESRHRLGDHRAARDRESARRRRLRAQQSPGHRSSRGLSTPARNHGQGPRCDRRERAAGDSPSLDRPRHRLPRARSDLDDVARRGSGSHDPRRRRLPALEHCAAA